LNSHYAVFLRRDRLTVNFVGGNLPSIESEWPCELLRGTKFSFPLPNRLIPWTLCDSLILTQSAAFYPSYEWHTLIYKALY
jgi:hypothetical protein